MATSADHDRYVEIKSELRRLSRNLGSDDHMPEAIRIKIANLTREMDELVKR
jgi:hypothetical protein